MTYFITYYYCNIFSKFSFLQGLRTLELCVDNLQPDFLFSHIEPVKAELMQVIDLKSWYKLNV